MSSSIQALGILLFGICMFAMQNRLLIHVVSSTREIPSTQRKGAREFKKLISSLLLRSKRFCSVRPHFTHQILSEMQNRSEEKRVPKQVLHELTVQLQFLFPNAERLKVRPFYNQGKLKAHATLGIRRIYVLGTPENIVQRFHQQHAEKLLSAFPQFSNPQPLAS